MTESRFVKTSVSKDTPQVWIVSLALMLAGCGQFQAHQPNVPDALAGADRLYAALPQESLTMSCNDVRNAASDLDRAGSSGQWDAATIEDIRRRLDYQPH